MKADTGVSNIEDMEGVEEENSKNNEMLGSNSARTTRLDHPFSIESILNGTTKRKKQAELEPKCVEENDALPLNALKEFTSKAFSTMKTNVNGKQQEEGKCHHVT